MLIKKGEPLYAQGDSRGGPPPAIVEYEKEKLTKMRQNIDRRFIAVRTAHPTEFFASPDDLKKRLKINKEKEGFIVVYVVQNDSGNMNFYEVKFDSGQMGYLSAEAKYLEFQILEGNIIAVSGRFASKKSSQEAEKKSVNQSKELTAKAVELVKNHPTLGDSVTGEKKSVEKKMRDSAKSYPKLKWRYEAKEIGNQKYRITQYVEEGLDRLLTRTWIVDLSTGEVRPENPAAKEMSLSPM
jgi:hypothetical protein